MSMLLIVFEFLPIVVAAVFVGLWAADVLGMFRR